MQEAELDQLMKALSKRWGSQNVVVAATKTATFDDLGALANALDDRFRINPSRPVKGWASLDDKSKKQQFNRLKMRVARTVAMTMSGGDLDQVLFGMLHGNGKNRLRHAIAQEGEGFFLLTISHMYLYRCIYVYM